MSERVDYDTIAPTYDARYGGRPYETVTEAIRRLVTAIRPEYALEVGCGTGHWLASLGDLIPHACGADSSLNMLRKGAGKLAASRLVRATAEALPFRRGCFDLIFCVNAVHHFPDLDGFIAEAWRLLRRGGTLAVIGMDPHRGRDRWCVHDYFPETRAIDLARFPSSGAIADAMLRAGFDRVECATACRITEIRIGEAVLTDPELQRRGCSQMALLTDDQYEAGINRVKSALQTANPNNPPEFTADIALMLQRAHRDR